MKFNDHILAERLPFVHAIAQARMDELCAMMIALLGKYATGHYAQYKTVLEIARRMRKEMRGFIKAAAEQRRYTYKLNMLRHPEWRFKVLQDLGGVNALLRCWISLARPKPDGIKRRTLVLTDEEEWQRAHAKRCAKATAHPNITRDPFKVDQEGEFRLPPVTRYFTGQPDNRIREYEYRAEPLCDFTGFKTPIMVWPEEFIAFMEMDAEQDEAVPLRVVKRESVRTWLSALQENLVKKRVLFEPVLSLQTARAPPVLLPNLIKCHLLPEQVGKGACPTLKPVHPERNL